MKGKAMIIRVTRAKQGLANYLKTGRRADSEYKRNERDKVLPLYGDLQEYEKVENYLNREKNYKDNYLHITLSFSSRERDKLYDTDGNINKELLRELTKETLKYYASGYDLEHEVIAYAEAHLPKIKEEKGKERLEHIHIALTLYNPLTDTQLRPPRFAIKYNELFQSYLVKKYGLEHPSDHPRQERNLETEIKVERDTIKELTKDIQTEAELLQFFKQNNIEFRKVETAKNTYYKIKSDSGKNINLRGKGLEHLEQIAKYGKVQATKERRKSYAEIWKATPLDQLEKELMKFYEKRAQEIDKRRSKAAKQVIRNIYEREHKQDNAIQPLTFQQKLLYKHYHKMIDNIGKGYYVQVDNDKVRIKSNAKKIDIVDKGDKITARGENLQEQVKIMLDLAEAKGWELDKIVATGSARFKAEVAKQINERLKLREQAHQSPSLITSAVADRPTNEVEREIKDRTEQKTLDKEYIRELKTNLDPNRVLEYVKEHYKLDTSIYEVVGNKINNTTDKRKPKNVIDFLQKEVHLDIHESFTVADAIYKLQQAEQAKDINTEREQEQHATAPSNIKGVDMPIKIMTNDSYKQYPVDNWRATEANKWSELATIVKTQPYSNIQWQGGYRKGDNAVATTNLLIIDIDNTDKNNILSIEQAKKLLESKNIAGLIVETKSSGKEKHGVVAERYRILIPTKKGIEIDDKETYRAFYKQVMNDIGLAEHYDEATADLARMYQKSPIQARTTITKGEAYEPSDALQKAREKVKREREARQAKLKEIEARVEAHGHAPDDKHLTYVNIEKIKSLPITELIKHFEVVQDEYKEGNYRYLVTDSAKYSVIDSKNIVHDFKSDRTYNAYEYVKEQIQANNPIEVARELENLTGEQYIELNTNAVKKAVSEALSSAKNDKEFENAIKEYFGVAYTRLDKSTLQIADKTIDLKEIGIEKRDLIEKFKENRAEAQRKRNDHSFGMWH